MHIALITRVFSPTYGGLERYQTNLARQLVRLGCRLTVYAQKSESEPQAPWTVIPITPRWRGPLHGNVHYTAALNRQLRRTDYDCVLANLPCHPCDVHRAGGGLNAVWYPLKVKELGWRYWFSHQLPKYRSALRLERRLYDPARVAMHIANSRLVKDQIVKQYGFPAERVAVIANGIDFTQFDADWRDRHRGNLRRQHGIGHDELVILCVANNFRRKGVGTIIAALEQAKSRQRLRLMVVGRGRPFKTGSNIHFAGHQPDIRPYYALADVLVLPTIYEPCANVVLEAMACGVVPVTTTTNGASEFIAHGQNGFVMTHWRDDDNLAAILDLLQSDTRMQETMGRAAQAAVNHLTLARNARQVLDVCRQAARNREAAL